eukprot:20621_2
MAMLARYRWVAASVVALSCLALLAVQHTTSATELVQYEQVEPEQMQYQSEQGVPQNWQQLRPISSADAQQLAQPSQAFSLGGS